MSKRISIIIPKKMNEELNNLQNFLKMDKSNLIRYLLNKSIQEVKIETMLNEYRKRKLSLGKAAELAGITLWEFIEYCRKNNIQLDLTEEDADIGINRVNKINIQEYKEKIKKKIESIEK
ncbi:MAG: UPF0175 family protein [Promethearchaeota archaeon]